MAVFFSIKNLFIDCNKNTENYLLSQIEKINLSHSMIIDAFYDDIVVVMTITYRKNSNRYKPFFMLIKF